MSTSVINRKTFAFVTFLGVAILLRQRPFHQFTLRATDRRSTPLTCVCLALSLLLGACGSSQNSTSDDNRSFSSSSTSSTGTLGLTLDAGVVPLIEGATSATNIPISLTRTAGARGTVVLDAMINDARLAPFTRLVLSDSRLDANEQTAVLSVQLAIGPRPIQPGLRTLTVIASDEAGNELLSASLDIDVSPTERPDVYLLIGQSNMVGFSEAGGKQAGPGGLDEPVERIRQLNVTGNDRQNFLVPADFVNPAKNYNPGLPLSLAVDPLHNGFDANSGGKQGDNIGLGLSFAKRALADTTGEIYLVPAAWSDTGFCKRNDPNELFGKGWNATVKNNEALAGTLLYERAVLRANIALEQTGGILRGILWHQGERDSSSEACASVYADNLIELAAALRSTINADARGPSARGEQADIPFLVGTMSRAESWPAVDSAGSSPKLTVDSVHRNVANLIPLSDFVETADLVPPDYPCGDVCVHFGAAAYRELGTRYYETLISLLP